MKTRSNQKKLATQSPAGSNPSDFHFEITKIAVSQICESVGFKSTNLSSLQTLSHIATLYIKSAAEIAASYSNRSNRTQSNLLDIISALHDLSLPHGFAGASELHRSRLLSSKFIKDLSVFVKINDEIPFAKPIPKPIPISIPIPAQIPLPQPDLNTEMIPKWLPEFPEECTYMRSSERRKARRCEVWEDSEMVRSWGGIEREKLTRETKENVNRDLRREGERVRFKIN